MSTVSASPSTVTAGVPTLLTLTGTGTAWTGQDPAGLFVVTALGGSSLGLPTVTSDTAATVTLTAGLAAPSSITLADNSTGATTPLTVIPPDPSMSLQFSSTVRTAQAQSLVDTIGANFTIEVRTGSAPGVGNSATGTLLATLTAGTWGTPSAGAVSFTTTADSSGDANGTPGHLRFKTSGGTAAAECDAAIGSGIANFTAGVSLGGTVTETSGTFTTGNS